MTGRSSVDPPEARFPRLLKARPGFGARVSILILVLAACASCARKGTDSSPAPAPAPATSEASADTSWGPGHARARLIADRAAAAPGESLVVGVSFDIQPGWHLYWNGANHTGYPIHVDPELPAGWSAGELLWPAPERHVSPGNILDHVYTGRVTLLLPVRAGAAEAGPATLRARLRWLACHQVCLPGSAEVALTLPVRAEAGAPDGGDGAPPGPDAAARFAEARARLPRPLAESPVPVSVSVEAAAAEIHVPGATRLVFFPGPGCTTLTNPIRDAAADGDRLRLSLSTEPGASPVVSGVLEVRRPGSPPAFYTLGISPPAGS